MKCWQYCLSVIVCAWLSLGAENLHANPLINPHIQIDNNGNSVVVWINRMTNTIQASTVAAGGSWSAPVTLSPTDQSAMELVTFMDSFGDVVVGWVALEQALSITSLNAVVLPSGGSWTAATRVSTTDELITGNFQIKLSSSNKVVATWESEQVSTGKTLISTATGSFDGTWSPPVVLIDSQN